MGEHEAGCAKVGIIEEERNQTLRIKREADIMPGGTGRMDYKQAVRYINSLQVKMKAFGLGEMNELVAKAGINVSRLKAVHVAGSKGKGSIAAFIASILREHGFRTGLYTSPHLLSERERIRINGKKISEKDFAGLVSGLKPFAEKMKRKPSYFEFFTAMAFKYFIEKEADWVVLETGMGGRLDATNVVQGKVCAFGPIFLEHEEALGNTIEKIAAEKAGIIKGKCITVVAKENRGARVIETAAKEKNCGIINPEFRAIEVTKDYSTFDSAFPVPGLKRLKIRLIGLHQLENAAIALGAIEGLRRIGVRISKRAVRQGLLNAQWPGRLQVAGKKPLVILDAAHTPEACARLMEAMELFEFERLILVFSCLEDKKAGKMLGRFSWHKLIVPQLQIARAAKARKILESANDRGQAAKNMASSLREAKRLAGPRDLILVTGSCYTVAEAMEALGRWHKKGF